MSPRAGLSADRVTALALEIVDRDGPDALTLARVAESAGVATPSLYKHIGGLADLRDRVSVRVVAELTGVSANALYRALTETPVDA